MARKQRLDRTVTSKLDSLEKSMYILKIEYEKYFMGIEQIEPMRQRDDVKRMIRTLMADNLRNSRQKYRFRQLRARFMSLDNYITRNIVLIERGKHPKMKFRADRREKTKAEALEARKRRPITQAEKEDAAYREVYSRYMKARGKCGQASEMSYESVREVLSRQVRTIKSRYRCNSVKFKVTVEDGKAKVTAVPMR